MAAMEARQFNAANTAIKGKAVLTGKWVERAEIGGPGEFDHLSDDELVAAIRERYAEFERNLITPDGGSDKRH